MRCLHTLAPRPDCKRTGEARGGSCLCSQPASTHASLVLSLTSLWSRAQGDRESTSHSALVPQMERQSASLPQSLPPASTECQLRSGAGAGWSRCKAEGQASQQVRYWLERGGKHCRCSACATGDSNLAQGGPLFPHVDKVVVMVGADPSCTTSVTGLLVAQPDKAGGPGLGTGLGQQHKHGGLQILLPHQRIGIISLCHLLCPTGECSQQS